MKVTERYTNRTYDRVPSPPGVKVGLLRSSKGSPEVDRSKEHSPTVTTRVRPASEKRRDVLKSALQPQKSLRARPQTVSGKREEERGTDRLSRTESKILLTVRDVLGHLITERGVIECSNLDEVMNYTRSRLQTEETVKNDGCRDITIKHKKSKTKVKAKSSSRNMDAGKLELQDSPNVGNPEVKVNTKLTGGNETAGHDNYHGNGNDSLGQPVKMSVAFQKEIVGDTCVNNERPLGTWKAGEEKDLRAYVESLVKQINKEMISNNQTHAPADRQGSAQTFCACNICTSDGISSVDLHRKDAQCHLTTVNTDKAHNNGADLKFEKTNSLSTAPTNRVRNQGMSLKSPSQVVKGRGNLPGESSRLESAIGLHIRQMKQRGGTRIMDPKTSYVLIDPVPAKEITENQYLERKKKQVVAKKPGSNYYAK